MGIIADAFAPAPDEDAAPVAEEPPAEPETATATAAQPEPAPVAEPAAEPETVVPEERPKPVEPGEQAD